MTNKAVVMCVCDGRGSASPSESQYEEMRQAGLAVTSGLCRGKLGDLASKAQQRDLVVGCTQEQQVMQALTEGASHPIQFVNLRGTQRAQPESVEQVAALKAKATFATSYVADGVPSIVFSSAGRVAIISGEHLHNTLLESVAGSLQVDLLVEDAASIMLSPQRRVNVLGAKVEAITGYLGAFEVTTCKSNPTDTELCTRCGACAEACPNGAVSAQNFTIDLSVCDGNRACVEACGVFSAINFDNLNAVSVREYDMVIDMRANSAFSNAQPPLGYWHTGPSIEAFASAILEATQTIGEFEKPKFFSYKQSVCAHSRSNVSGCSACIDTCSTRAISSKGQGVEVNPHLCLGCGACTAVCPTGAIQYALTPAQSILRAARESLKAYRTVGGKRAHIVLHADSLSHNWLEMGLNDLSIKQQGLIPIELHHGASTGPDTWLGLLAFGANQVTIVLDPAEWEFYGAALSKQVSWVNEITSALGLGSRVEVTSTVELGGLTRGELTEVSWTVAQFDASADKRTRLTFAIEHLAQQIQIEQPIALSKPAPFGAVLVDADKCTLCMSCTGACPASALIDNPLEPQLRFIERNCVQCGLCAETCPENAISLVTQIDLTSKSKEKRVLNQSQPFHCTSCGKAFGTKHMIENMVKKLSGHSMFESNAKRLTMCGDCRVVNMFEDKNEMTIFEVKR